MLRISIPLRYNLEPLSLPTFTSGINFNSTKVQFGESEVFPPEKNRGYFNSTKVQFGVPLPLGVARHTPIFQFH